MMLMKNRTFHHQSTNPGTRINKATGLSAKEGATRANEQAPTIKQQASAHMSLLAALRSSACLCTSRLFKLSVRSAAVVCGGWLRNVCANNLSTSLTF